MEAKGRVMNFYAFHIGDYASATRHLTWTEDAAYRRLLDVYYVKEGPLPADLRQVYRLAVAGSEEQREAVDSVLSEFFRLTEAGYVHSRCEKEIATATDKRVKASQSAKARWGNAKSESPALPSQSERNANASKTPCERIEKSCDGNAPNPNPNPNPINTAAQAPDVQDKPARVSRSDKTLSAYLEQCEENGSKAIPDDHYVRGYMESAGITADMAAMAWHRFREEHTTGTRKAKRYKDWPATFANSVKDRWYKLWAVNASGEANWTADGLQTKRVFEAQNSQNEGGVA